MDPLFAQRLKELNEQFSSMGIPHKQRPWRAIEQLSKDQKRSFAIPSGESKEIFKWFEENSPPGAHVIAPRYTAAFYFDTCFWPVNVPMFYGTVRLNAYDSLSNMPPLVKELLTTNRHALSKFVGFWLNCLDYAAGIDEAAKAVASSKFAFELMRSAEKELASSTALLLESANIKALEDASLAAEMFAKSFIAGKRGLTEKQAKELGHDLSKALKVCIEVDPQSELRLASNHCGLLPDINDRYKARSRSKQELWLGYDLAHFIGTTVVRSITGRDVRKTVSIEGGSFRPIT